MSRQRRRSASTAQSRCWRDAQRPWHYMNIEIAASGYSAATDCKGILVETPTRWPTAQPSTPSPITSIRPTASWPGTRGHSIGKTPSPWRSPNDTRRKPRCESAPRLPRDRELASAPAQAVPGRPPAPLDRSTGFPHSVPSTDKGSRRPEGEAVAPLERPPQMEHRDRAPLVLPGCFGPVGPFALRGRARFWREGNLAKRDRRISRL
jgi:hypothetical protein